MDQMLKAIPINLRMKMEGLVQDLSNALEESSRCTSARRRWGFRRRARSTGNIPLGYHKAQSDDSSSDTGDRKKVVQRDQGIHSVQQVTHPIRINSNILSDSDDVGLVNGVQRHLTPYTLQSRQIAHLHGNFESDSLNENFSPVHPNPRRRRKCKRMAVDPVEGNNPSTSHTAIPVPLSSGKKKHVKHSANCENRFNNILCGKRKRSMRERSIDCDGQLSAGFNPSRILAINKLSISSSDEAQMEFRNVEASQSEMMSSSSLSNSDSDTGIYTNDEGREGDDEHSDWFGGETVLPCGDPEVKGWWEKVAPPTAPRVGADSSSTNGDPTFHAILSGSFKHMSEEAKQAYKMKIQWTNGREIRVGRRRLQCDKPGFSIFTSANEKYSRFLQDPAQSQLRNTTQAVRVEQVAFSRMQARLHHNVSDFKRRRKTPPITAHFPQALEGRSVTDPIPESNIGNQMLRAMGWEPGTGLGPHSSGIQEPVVAVTRPKYQGLMHNPSYKSS